MNETILLRLKPKLGIVLNESDFEIIDSGETGNEGVYSYRSTESIEFHQEKINWFVTIWSYIFGIVTETGAGNKFKDKAHLKITMNRKTLKIRLHNVDMANIETLKNKLTNKITLSPPTSQNT